MENRDDALWKKEFPSMKDLGIVIPEGFADFSWHNDVCPHFFNKEKMISLFVDFENVEDREIVSNLRYSLHKSDEDAMVIENLHQTESAEEILDFIKNYRVQDFKI